MTDLSGAMRQKREYKKTILHESLGYGAHKGYFVGLGDTVKEQVQCRRCNGFGSKDGEQCRKCKATGEAIETKVALRYHLQDPQGNDFIQEEWVNYSLSGPGVLKNGQPKSPTTLHLRVKSLSGGLTDEQQMSAWYSALPKPIKIPVELMVMDNPKGDGLVIAAVRKLQPRSQQPQPIADSLQEDADALFGND